MPGSFDGRSSTGGDSQPQGLAGIGLLMQQVVPPALPSPALSVPPFARGVLRRLERVFARKMAVRLAPPPLAMLEQRPISSCWACMVGEGLLEVGVGTFNMCIQWAMCPIEGGAEGEG